MQRRKGLMRKKRKIIFQREGKNIIAEVYSRQMESLGRRKGYQEVLFCEDKDGSRYRVPRSEVIARGR